jgi:putative FmdB family regulatory protein
MPTYHYECEKCGHDFEIDQKITDSPKKVCPKCRGKLFRVIHAVSHILKGSGFYTTDYRSENFAEKEKAEKGTADVVSSCAGCDKCDKPADKKKKHRK